MKRKIYDDLVKWKNEKNGTTALVDINGVQRSRFGAAGDLQETSLLSGEIFSDMI